MPNNWTDTNLTNKPVKTIHITEIRDVIDNINFDDNINKYSNYLSIFDNAKNDPNNPLKNLTNVNYNTLITNSVSYFGQFTNAVGLYGDGVLAADKLYYPPFNSTNILVIDPNTDTYITFGNFTGTNLYTSFIRGVGNKLFGIPHNSNNILLVDISNNNITTLNNIDEGNYAYFGGVFAPNKKIYCAPFNANNFLIIDTELNNFTKIPSNITGVSKYCCGALVNNYIYFAPHKSTQIIKFNINDNTFTTFGNLDGSKAKWVNSILAPNGKIYCIPGTNEYSSILVIDPTNDTTYTFGNTNSEFYYGARLGLDGNIYAPPTSGNYALKIDTTNDTITTFGDNYFNGINNKYSSGVLAPNGSIYAAPFYANKIMKISYYSTNNNNFQALTNYLNKC